MTTALSPANEAPAVVNADSTGSGSVTVIMNVTRDSSGTITGGFTKTGVAVTASQANSLAGGIACYFNVHTTLTPGGAARGQLALQ